jgi:ubiquitin-protein ligase
LTLSHNNSYPRIVTRLQLHSSHYNNMPRTSLRPTGRECLEPQYQEMQRFLDSPDNPGYPENPQWSVTTIEDNIYEWNVVISGERDTIWEDAPLRFKLSFGGTYPLCPPIVVFDPPIYHPNVRYERIMNGPRGDVGRVFIHMLLNSNLGCWNVNITAKDVILKMRELLEHPDLRWDGQQNNVVANWSAHDLYQQERVSYNREVLACIAQLPPPMAPAPAAVLRRSHQG